MTTPFDDIPRADAVGIKGQAITYFGIGTAVVTDAGNNCIIITKDKASMFTLMKEIGVDAPDPKHFYRVAMMQAEKVILADDEL